MDGETNDGREMSNSIAFARKHTSVIDKVYQMASVPGVLNPERRMVRAGHKMKKLMQDAPLGNELALRDVA